MIKGDILLIGDTIALILQPLYFSMFMIYSKNLKCKRLIFILAMIIEHFILRYCIQLKFSINFELTYTIITYLLLKLIYREKARITDVIIFIISTLFLGVISISMYFIIGMNLAGLICVNVIPIISAYLLRHKLSKINQFFNRFWNKHENSKMIKSITVRGISSIITILSFISMHIWIIYGILKARR